MARPTTRILSRATIAETALAILDEEGAEALTLRRIAQRMGVRAPSLYNHVTSRDDILDAVTELITTSFDFSGIDTPDWRAGLLTFAHSYRRVYAAHPNAAPLIACREVRTEIALSGYDRLLHRLIDAGFTAAQGLRILLIIDYLALGSAITPFDGLLNAPADRHPVLATTIHDADADRIDDDAFDLAVRTLLAGLHPT